MLTQMLTQFLEIGQVQVNAANLPFYHIPKVFKWIQID